MGYETVSLYSSADNKYGTCTATWDDGPEVQIEISANCGWKLRTGNASPYPIQNPIEQGTGDYTGTITAQGDGDVIAFMIYSPLEEDWLQDFITIDYDDGGGSSGDDEESPGVDVVGYVVHYSKNNYSWDYFPSDSDTKYINIPLELPQPYKNDNTETNSFNITCKAQNVSYDKYCVCRKHSTIRYTFDGWDDIYNGVLRGSYTTVFNENYGACLYAKQSSIILSETYSNNTIDSLPKFTLDENFGFKNIGFIYD